jgi:hypothetical protein
MLGEGRDHEGVPRPPIHKELEVSSIWPEIAEQVAPDKRSDFQDFRRDYLIIARPAADPRP